MLRAFFQKYKLVAIGSVGLGLAIVAGHSATAVATVPGATWTVSAQYGGSPTFDSPNLTSTGSIIAPACQSIASSGTIAWSRPLTCSMATGDASGNSYVETEDAEGNPVVMSLDSKGGVRWTTPTGGFGPFWVARPALGANGSVYFSVFDGHSFKILGFDEATGAVTLDKGVSDTTGLYAYQGGLVAVIADNAVEYMKYDGTEIGTYSAGTPISAGTAYSNTNGADGSVFLAGYGPACNSSPFNTEKVSVAKFSPSGRTWVWTEVAPHQCGQTELAATPDGGVVLTRDEHIFGPTADFTSVGQGGALRWEYHAIGPLGPAYGGGYLIPAVAVNGVVALPSNYEYTCPTDSFSECRGIQIDFVSQTSTDAVRPELQVTDPSTNQFYASGIALDVGRLYLASRADAPSLSMFTISGLATDYRVALQEATTSAGGLQVQPPVPTPPLPPVTTANGGGGGGGMAGAPDPSSFEHGRCDPGSDTSWLKIAGTTFTCIVSGDVWNDPTLISAKKKCVINTAITFTPFVKVLKWKKYVKEADTVTAALKLLAKQLASTSYPTKMSADARAVDDVRTAFKAISTPEQAILTVVSSRRVLDGLITKLGKGSPQALKLAQSVAVVKTAVVGLIEVVSGIRDVKECVIAFKGP